MTIQEFCETYKPIVKNLAVKFNRTNSVEYLDLYQEGMAALIKIYRNDTLSNIKSKAYPNYIKIIIRGTLLNFISNMSGTINVNHNKFYDKDFVQYDYVDSESQIDNIYTPQDVRLIEKEKHIMLDKVLEELIPTLNDKELFVWNHIINANTPLTTRKAAELLGYKSGSSITYIKNKIIDKVRRCIKDG